MSTTMQLVWYTDATCEERALSSPEEVLPYLERDGVTWLHIQNLENATVVHQVGEVMGLHPLAVEDVLSPRQRPKVEEYDGLDFVVTHQVRETLDHEVRLVQLCLFVGPNYLVSFQEGEDDASEPVRLRVRMARGHIRQQGVDHLMYALLDAAIDGYFPVLEGFGEYLEFIQEQTLLRQDPDALLAIQRAKHELLAVRRTLWPQREMLNVLLRDDNGTVTEPVKHYLRDCYDHVAMLIDTVETYREMASDLMDAYLSAVSNRMNSVMKVLTVIATIFMPLTFIVGLYGMNFRTDVSRWNMPELVWPYGYPAVWGVMLLSVVVMLFYFRRLGWIGQPDIPPVNDGGDSRPALLERFNRDRKPRRPGD